MNPTGLRSVPNDDDLKVVVRFCAGYQCRQTVTTHRVRQNVNGQREYCSLLCYHRWPPAMRKVIACFPEYEQSPSGLEALLADLRRDHGNHGAALITGYSRSTLGNWLKKLQLFRKFAGQSPEAILLILKRVADDQGLNEAAKLIAVDPKTLNRAFAEYDNTPEKLAS